MKAIWNDIVIAQSDDTIVIENNHYFPPHSVKQEYVSTSDKQSVCPWKGQAAYLNLEVGGKVNKDAAWYYPEPKDAAKEIKDHIAFWKGVTVTS